MEKKEAIQLLDGAVAQLSTTRQVHIQLQEAINTLKVEEKPKDVKQEKK